jgi:hypothetical protein
VENAREWGDMEVGFLSAWFEEESFRYGGHGLCCVDFSGKHANLDLMEDGTSCCLSHNLG